MKPWSNLRQRSAAPAKNRRRAFLEQLETRQVLTAPISPEFPAPLADNPGANLGVQGNLFITAARSADHNNLLRISTDGAGNYHITDANFTWSDISDVPGGQLSADGHTLIFPMSGFFGEQILVNGGDGNDTLTFDFAGGNPIPVGGFVFYGGSQTSESGDEIELTGGSADNVDYTFINENDGSITVDGRRVDYVGLEPVTDNLDAANRSFTFTGATETVTVSDVAAAGLTRINSTLGELVDFAVPTASLTIITNGGDTTTINAFDPAFNTPLISLQGTNGGNTYRLGAANVIPNGSALSLTGDANFDLNGFSEEIGSLASTNALPTVTLTTGTLTVGNLNTDTTYSGALAGNGELRKVGTGRLSLTGDGAGFTGITAVNAGVLAATVSPAVKPLGTSAIRLNGGTLDVVVNAMVHSNALGHYGYHINSDFLTLHLDRNNGMINLGDPSTYSNFQGLGLLTSGPGNRGLDFDNDADFNGVPASLLPGAGTVISQADNYSNLWIGTLTPDVSGNWGLRNNQNDDIIGIWFDIDRDGVFESTIPGLGDNRGEQVNFDSTTNRTIALTAGLSYPIAFFHREGTGGSTADFRFTRPATTEAVVRPDNPAQAGFWNFRDLTSIALGNNVSVSANSTLNAGGNVTFGNLAFTTADADLVIESTQPGGELRSKVTFAGTTSLSGNNVIDNDANVELVSVVSEVGAGSGITKSGAGTLALSGANTFSGNVVVSEGILQLRNNSALGDEVGKTTIQAGATLDIRGSRAGAAGNELVEVSGTGVGGHGAIVNTGAGQNDAFRRLTLLGDTTLRADSRYDVRNTGGVATFDMGNFTLTKVGTSDFSVVAATVANPGNVNLNQGIFRLQTTSDFDNSSATIAVASGSTFEINNSTQTYDVNLNVASGGNVTVTGGGGATVTGLVTLGGTNAFAINNNLTLSGRVTGAGGFTKSGAAILAVLSNASDYAGTNTISAGTFRAAAANALGTTAGTTLIANGATLLFDATAGPFTTANERIQIGGFGIGNAGALQLTGGNVTFGGDLNLMGSTMISSNTPGSTLTLSGSISREQSGELALAGVGDLSITSDILTNDYLLTPFNARVITGAPPADVGSEAAINAALTATPTRSATLDGPLTLPNLAAFNALFNTPTPVPLTDNFFTLFETTLTVIKPGVYTFAATNNDDGAAVWLKPVAQADFVAGDRVQLAGNNNTAVATRTLTAGTYTLVYAHREVTGGEAMTGRMQGPGFSGVTPATSLNVINPATSDAAINHLVKTGTGTATLSGNNTYNGVTLVHQGTLEAGGNTAFGPTTPVTALVPIGNTVQQWQLGSDNTATTEFVVENGTSNSPPGSPTAVDDDWYFAGVYPAPINTLAANEATNLFERALTIGDPTNRIHFNLTPEQLNDNYQLVIDIIGSSFTLGPTIPFEVQVNGVTVHTQTITANTIVTTPTFNGTSVGLVTGDNVVTLTRSVAAGTGNHVQFDFIRLNRQNLIEASNVQVQGGTTLALVGGTTLSEAVTINDSEGSGLPGTISSNGGANIVSGGVNLTADGAVSAAAGATLTVNSVIQGANDLAKTGAGTVILAGANTYTGLTSINQGTLVAANNAALGATSAATTVNSGATLALDNTLNGNLTIAEGLTISGEGVSGSGALRNILGNNLITGSVLAQGVAPPAAMSITTGLELWLDAANVTTAGAFVTSWNDQIFGDNTIANNGTPANDDKRPTWVANALNGRPAVQFDGLDTAMGDRLDLTGTLNLTTNATIFFVALDGPQSANTGSCCRPIIADRSTGGGYGDIGYNIAFLRPAAGQPGIRVDKASLLPTNDANGVNTMTPISLGTTPSNAFHIYALSSSAAVTEFYEDSVLLASANLVSTPTSPTGYDIGGHRDNVIRHYQGQIAEMLAFNGTLSAGDRAIVEDYLFDKYFAPPSPPGDPTITSAAGTLTLSGSVSIPDLVVEGAGNVTISGVVQNAPSETGTVTKDGTGTLTLAGTNTYTGATTVTAGTLQVNGSNVSSATTVQTGGTLAGNGTNGLVTVNTGGTYAPGATVGTSTVTGNLVQNGALAIQIASPSGSVAGTDYDQVRIVGSGTLTIGAAATLAVTYTGAAGTFNPGTQPYVVINNDGSDVASGTFVGLAEGATVTVDGRAMILSYVGGDGNDVTLTAVTSVLYVNDQFTGAAGTSVDGDGETAGVQAAVIGTTAFASVGAALAANPGFTGSIVVNGGTYASALLAGGGNVTLRLVQDGVTEPNVVFNDLSGDAGDAIITRFNGVANANVTIAQGSFSGVISGAGSVTKSTAGVLELLGTNTYTGATTVGGGTLRVTGSIVPSATTVQSGATLTGAGTTGAVTVNSGGVQQPGVGTAVGFANVQGNYVQNGGLTIEISSIAGTTAGTDYDQVRVTGSGSVALGGTSTLVVNYTGAAGTFNPTTGAIYRIIDNDGAVPGDTTGAFSGLPNGSIITVDGRGMQIQYLGGDGNDVVLVAQAPVVALYVDDDFPATGTVDGDLETAGMQSAVMGTSAFQSVGAALAANPGYAGIIIVNGGVYTGGAMLAGGGNVTLRLVQDLANNEPNVTFNNLSGDAGDQIITRFNNSANANLVVTSGSFSGVISGTGNVVKNTSGTVTLSGANTFSGLTDVQAGVLTIANASALGSGAGGTTVANGAQLQLSGGIVVSGESVTITGQGVGSVGALNNLSGNNEWAGPVVIAAGGNNRVGSTAGNLTLSGVISGGQAGVMGGLTVRNGAGTTIVSGGANTYLGDTTVVVGTLRLAGGANRLPVGTKLALGNTAGVSPAVFDLGGQNQTVAGLYNITPSSPMVMEVTNSGALATLTVDVTSGTDTYGGVITGAVNLTKSGAGVLALTTVGGNNSNTHTGTTLVSGGRLHLSKTAGQNAIPGALDITTGGLVTFGANNQIADTASVTVSGATSIFNGTAINAGQLPNLQETIGNLTLTGGTFQTGAGSAWNIAGTGSFTGGAGNTLFLGNSNSEISFGSLVLTGMTATPGGTVSTPNSFAIYGSGPAVGTVTVGSGGLVLNGSVFNLRQGSAGSRLVLNGDVTATGTSSIIVDPGSGSGGIAQVELGSTAGAANRAFAVTSGTLTVSALVADGAATPGSLTKSGAGTFVLSSANTYTGTTNANGGVLQLSGGAAILDTAGPVNVGLGGTLQLLANETVSSYSGLGDAGAGTNDSTLALGAFTLTTTGSAALANVTGSAGAAIVAGTNITDADDDNNITSPNITLTAATGIGASGDPLETTVANLEASGGTGGVFIANTGDLVIGGIGGMVGVSATGGGINVSTTGNLTLNENVTGPAAVTLSAADNATLIGNVTSGTTITVNIDFGDADAAGGVLTLTGTLTAPGGATLNGGSNNDTFNLRPQTGAAITVNGFDPQMTTTGDVLNLDLTGAVNQQLALGSIGAGVWTFAAPLQTVSYTSIEEMNANAPYHLALDANAAAFGNTGVADLITIRQSGANLIVERTGAATAPDNDDVGVIFQGAIASIQSFTYIGSGDADILTVSDAGGLPQFGSTAPNIPDNANLAGTGSILFDGNGGADDLVFNLTGANGSLTYAMGSGSGAASTEGEVRVTSGALALQAYVVDTELIERIGTGATPGALSILGDSGVNAIAVTASGADTFISAPGYTSLGFSGNNFSALTIDGLGGADTIELVSLGTGQTNNPPVTLNGGLGDDTLRVHSTSGNTSVVTLNGNAGSDHFILQSATNTVDGIVGPVIVDGSDGIVGGNDDRLTIVDSGDTTGDTVFVNAVNAATSSDYRVEGITSTAGDDVILRNIDTLSYTGTSGNDTIDAQFTSTTPAHDLAVATLNGWTGGDQFLLFTSDQIGGTGPTPSGTPSGLASITLNGDAPGNPNAADGNDIFGQLPPGIVGTGNPGLAVPDSVRGIRPSGSTAITINGGQPTAPVGTPGDSAGDVLNLDTSGLPSTSSLVLATLSGQLAGAGIEPLSYGQIEDLNYITNNTLINLQLGDTLVRATSGPDTIIFSRNPTPGMPNGVRVRMGTLVVDFPMNGKTLTEAGDGNDLVTHSNVTFPMEVHGGGGDDMLFGGTGNDLLVGGLGNDQINASAGDNIVFGDNAPTSADPTPQDSAIGGNDVLSALGGTDVFYGGGGNDHVSPGAGNDYIHGGAGDDLLDGAQGDDRIYGGPGHDVISGSEGHDLLVGGAGNDQLFGRDGNDILIGGDGVDMLDGGSGDDLLIGANVANQSSSWTSTTNGTTFPGSLYQKATDNDAALLALLNLWSTSGNRSGLAAISDDGALDTIFGYTGNDDFSATPGEAQDRNGPSMGSDESI